MKSNFDIERLRSYSCIFSRSVFSNIIDNNDCSRLDRLFNRFDSKKNKEWTYFDYLKYLYRTLSENYRCEYIYKNTLVDSLLKEFGTKNSLILNEFRVGNSVADIVIFNGTSKAYEIKTELDSNKRLNGQLSDYAKIFQESYIVTHESLVNKYEILNDAVGIIALIVNNGKLKIKTVRPAIANKEIDINILIRSIRTNEYKNIVQAFYGLLPKVNSFDMFETCKKMMYSIPPDTLYELFLTEIKKRKSDNALLDKCQKELKQFCLSININKAQYDIFSERLSKPINI
jgi:hypothetical protein